MKNIKRERTLIVSDLHIPDQDIKTLKLVYKFIDYYHPDKLYILGDLVNFTKISKYEQDPFYETSVADEIADAKDVLLEFTTRARKGNPKVEILLFEGNHEQRMSKFLNKNASQIATLTCDDELLISVPHILELKKFGIKWVPYYKIIHEHNVAFLHGQTVRVKSGFSAHANIDKFGVSGFTGHTHRLAHVTRTQSGDTKFWIETGCICNLSPEYPSGLAYALSPDWTQGFATIEYDHVLDKVFPTIVPIINHSFIYSGELFK